MKTLRATKMPTRQQMRANDRRGRDMREVMATAIKCNPRQPIVWVRIKQEFSVSSARQRAA